MTMMFAVPVPVNNTNPSLGPSQGNKQAINIYDPSIGTHRTVIASPEECDKYLKDRKAAQTKGVISGLAGITALTTAAGAGIGAIAGKKETKTINQLVDKANELLKLGKSEMEATFRTEKWWEVDKLYDKASNTFKKISDNSKIKEFAGKGAFYGVLAGIILGGLALTVKTSKRTNAITEEFIAKHNQVQKTEDKE